MGVSKVGGGGKGSPPNGWRSLVLGEGGPCRIWRSGGFPNFPGKSSPSSPSHPFPPFFSPSTLSSNSFAPQTPPSNSLEQALSAFSTLSSLLFLFLPLPTSLRPLSDPFRTPPESLHRVPKRPKQPFLGLFRGIPKTPQKGAKNPLFDPFFTLPYPL